MAIQPLPITASHLQTPNCENSIAVRAFRPLAPARYHPHAKILPSPRAALTATRLFQPSPLLWRSPSTETFNREWPELKSLVRYRAHARALPCVGVERDNDVVCPGWMEGDRCVGYFNCLCFSWCKYCCCWKRQLINQGFNLHHNIDSSSIFTTTITITHSPSLCIYLPSYVDPLTTA